MDIPADLLQPDGFPRPGLYDCQPAPAPGVDLRCLYFYWNGVRYSARPIGNLAALAQAEAASTIAVKTLALQQQKKAAAGACFADTPKQSPEAANLLAQRAAGLQQFRDRELGDLTAAERKDLNERQDRFNRQFKMGRSDDPVPSIPATPQPTAGSPSDACFAGTPVPALPSSARSPLELADRAGFLRGFAAAKALLLAVEPPKLPEDLSGLKGWDDPRAGQLQGQVQERPAEASPTARYSYNDRITYLENQVEKLWSMVKAGNRDVYF